MSEPFRRFARRVATATGSAWAFVLAVLVIVAWLVTGPLYGYSNTWQLVINTGTTIVTFLMVFLIQNTQNRDSLALHLKLDELIRAQRTARNGLVDLEDLSDAELRKLQREFERLRRGAPTDDGQSFGELAVAAEQVRNRRARRAERGTRGERPERGERPARGERPDRGERAARGERTERRDRGDRPERGEGEQRRRRGAGDTTERARPSAEEGSSVAPGRDEGEPRPPRQERPPRESAGEESAGAGEAEAAAGEGETPGERAERAERARRRRRRRRGGAGRRDAGATGGAGDTSAPAGGGAPPPAVMPPVTDGES